MSKVQTEAEDSGKGEWHGRLEQETTKRRCQATLQAQRGEAVRPPIRKLPVNLLKRLSCFGDLALGSCHGERSLFCSPDPSCQGAHGCRSGIRQSVCKEDRSKPSPTAIDNATRALLEWKIFLQLFIHGACVINSMLGIISFTCKAPCRMVHFA